MICMPSSNVRPQQVDAFAPLSLLLDIPRDIAPNILSRLPAPSLLNLARTCKQLPIVDGQDLLRSWACRELRDISLLENEPLWTRTLDLVASCGHLINAVEWTTFLDVVESGQPGYAMLLQIAVFSLKVGSSRECLGGVAYSTAPDFNEGMCKTLKVMVEGAEKEAWKAEAAGAIIAGLWRHSAMWNLKEIPYSYYIERLFLRLPLAVQCKFIPLMLDPEWNDVEKNHNSMTRPRSNVAYSHVIRLSPDALPAVGPKYLLALSRMFGIVSCTNLFNGSCTALREMLANSLSKGMRIGPWREQPPEIALFVLLALHYDRNGEGIKAGLGKQLLESHFMTRQEYLDSKTHSSPHKVIADTQQWMAVNRETQAKDRTESVCTIS